MKSRLALISSYYALTRVPIWIMDTNKEILYRIPDMDDSLIESLKDSVLKVPFDYKSEEFQYYSKNLELYAMFATGHEPEKELDMRVVCGPFLTSPNMSTLEMRALSFSENLSTGELQDLVSQLPATSFYRATPYLQHLMQLFGMDPPSKEEFYTMTTGLNHPNVQSVLVENLFDNQENLRHHTPYSEEKAVLNCVKEGNLKRLESTYQSQPEIVYGKMSDQPVRQLFYGCIANTTLVTRYAIEGGLDEETAFTLSDIYIQRMERCRTIIELNKINEEMAADFTIRVAEAKQQNIPAYSRQVVKCIDYISQNTHQKLTLEVLADYVGLTPKYLSYLFHKETGTSLRVYVEQQKIMEAKNLLLYTKYSYSEISEYLAFSSQSHFISVFKKNTGVTPKEFREKQ